MSPIVRAINFNTTKLNVLTGNPVAPFDADGTPAPGHYFAEQVAGGWRLYRTGLVASINKKPIGRGEMVDLLDSLLANPEDHPLTSDGAAPWRTKSPVSRQVNSKTTALNVLTGNPVAPFDADGAPSRWHYFAERVTGGWMLYQNTDGPRDTCVRVFTRPMTNGDILGLLDNLLEYPPENAKPTALPRESSVVIDYEVGKLRTSFPNAWADVDDETGKWRLVVPGKVDFEGTAAEVLSTIRAAVMHAALEAVNLAAGYNQCALSEAEGGMWTLLEHGQIVTTLDVAAMTALLRGLV